MLIFLGAVLSLILVSLLRTTIVCDKVDYETSQVYSLFCTFERGQFEVEAMMSNATGQKVTRVNVIIGNEYFPLYTYDALEENIVDVGLLHWNNGQLLAFSSEKLEDGIDYVVDNGRITYLTLYGSSDSRPIVKIDKIHQRNWFDDFVSENSIEISVLMGFVFVLACSLFCLPFIEYQINYKIEKRKIKRRKKVSKKATND